MKNRALVFWKWPRSGLRLALFALLAFLIALPTPALAERAVKQRVPPSYPEMAKRMKITGSVKMEATVDAAGNVTDVKVIEGNSMLAPAAEEAVRKWKFESASSTTTESVVLKFNLAF